MNSTRLTVKVLSRLQAAEWARYFPGEEHIWGECRFVFDPDDHRYDWLVVYNDLPQKAGERFPVNLERLACARDNTLLVTHEPPNVKIYGDHFTRQFGHVLTSQPEWALPHTNRIFSQPALNWYYGRSPGELRDWQSISRAHPKKTRQLSTVCAKKQHRTSEHVKRDHFVELLKSRVPVLEIFGRGIRPVDDKAETIDAYFHHVAVENYMGRHHWTEKLADSYLGLALPFYAGCPNAIDYFPEKSFVTIDLDDMDASIETINKVLQDKEYEHRLPDLLEARRRLLEQYNFFAVVSTIAQQRHQQGTPANAALYSRRTALMRSPVSAVNYFINKARAKARLK